MQTAEITVTEGGSEYVVAVTAQTAQFFENAARRPDIRSKSGEELVSALIGIDARQREITRITRKKDGNFNDGARGEAGETLYHPDGRLYISKHYKDGRLNDTVRNAAVMEFNERGQLRRVHHYREGVLNDPAQGTPAVMEFNAAGERLFYGFYTNGVKTAEKFKPQLDAELDAQIAKETAVAVKTAFGSRLKLVP